MEITVDTGYLNTEITEMRDALAKVRNGMNNVYNQVAELDTMWTGPANDEFNRQFNKDKSMLEELCNIIDQIISSMDNSRHEYDICEGDVRQIIAELRS